MVTSESSLGLRVLAIASHVTYGYVGNKMVTFVLQALGCDVSAINTVNFSNHTAYKQWKGRRTPADEMQELYDGLRESQLHDFDMMLSGYAASREAVETVGAIGRDQRLRASLRPGSFFWILDPVMGDQGRLYVSQDVVPAYRGLLRHADLILPNAFEASQLAETEIGDLASLATAVKRLHREYQVPHIIVTSLQISPTTGQKLPSDDEIVIVGSSCRSDLTPRLFSVTVPALPVYFSGTGDLFASLMLVRLREAVASAAPECLDKRAWQSPDDVEPASLPLAKATEKVLLSMHGVLEKTLEERDRELANQPGPADGDSAEDKRLKHLRQTRASEVRVVQCVEELRRPSDRMTSRFVAQAIDV